MDKRRKPRDSETERAMHDQFDQAVADNSLSIAEMVRLMRKLSGLTQPEFAKHRGISVLTHLESGIGSPKLDTLNKVASIFGLTLGFVKQARRSPPAQSPAALPPK